MTDSDDYHRRTAEAAERTAIAAEQREERARHFSRSLKYGGLVGFIVFGIGMVDCLLLVTAKELSHPLGVSGVFAFTVGGLTVTTAFLGPKVDLRISRGLYILFGLIVGLLLAVSVLGPSSGSAYRLTETIESLPSWAAMIALGVGAMTSFVCALRPRQDPTTPVRWSMVSFTPSILWKPADDPPSIASQATRDWWYTTSSHGTAEEPPSIASQATGELIEKADTTDASRHIASHSCDATLQDDVSSERADVTEDASCVTAQPLATQVGAQRRSAGRSTKWVKSLAAFIVATVVLVVVLVPVAKLLGRQEARRAAQAHVEQESIAGKAPVGYMGTKWLMSMETVQKLFPDAIEFSPGELKIDTEAFGRRAFVDFMFGELNALAMIIISFQGEKSETTYASTQRLVVQQYGEFSIPSPDGKFLLSSRKTLGRVSVEHFLYKVSESPIEQVLIYRNK